MNEQLVCFEMKFPIHWWEPNPNELFYRKIATIRQPYFKAEFERVWKDGDQRYLIVQVYYTREQVAARRRRFLLRRERAEQRIKRVQKFMPDLYAEWMEQKGTRL